MKLDFKSDSGHAGRGAVGLIVLETDETMEPELTPILYDAGLSVYHSRIPFDPVVAPETLARMAQDLPRAAGLFPAVDFRAVGYGCTSASTVIGPKRVHHLISDSVQTDNVTDPISAALAALRALNARRVGFLTPYRADVSERMRALFEKEGLEISTFASFDEEEDHKVAQISEESVLDGMRVVGVDCDVVFSACTNLRSFNVIDTAEAELGIPVISSNSALAWHLGKLAQRELAGPGVLFKQAK